MPLKDFPSGPHGSPVSTTVEDGSDPLASVGQFVLELIRRAALRGATPDAPLRERVKALEAQLGDYKEAEHRASLCGPLLIEAQRNLLERTEEAKVAGRKFIDTAALLRAANEEISHLKAILQDKERELSELKQNSVQMISDVRALVAMIEASRAPAKQPANAAAAAANLH